MLNRLKYHLFRKLMNDICKKSQCENCHMELSPESYMCAQNLVFRQAHTVWNIDQEELDDPSSN